MTVSAKIVSKINMAVDIPAAMRGSGLSHLGFPEKRCEKDTRLIMRELARQALCRYRNWKLRRGTTAIGRHSIWQRRKAMPFSEDVVKQAWERANGQCECRRRTHIHFYVPCAKDLIWKNRGTPDRGGWEAHHITTYGGDLLSNCEIICRHCYESII